MKRRLLIVQLGLMIASTGYSAVREGSFHQKLNHFDSRDVRSFTQRFFADSSYATQIGSPVLLVICGEGQCGPGYLNGTVRLYAKAMGAYIVALEHRYYGKSQPFAQLTAPNLQFLTVEQALRDIADFRRLFTNRFHLSGPWIAVGCSYAASLAAFARSEYPQLFAAAVASSGPVEAREDFEDYDLHVARVLGPRCLKNVRQAVGQIDDAVGDPNALAAIKKGFGAGGIDDRDFSWRVSSLSGDQVQYGNEKPFCSSMDSARPLEVLAALSKKQKAWGLSDILKYQDANIWVESGFRQFYYQMCSQLGMFYTAFRNPNFSVTPRNLDLRYYHDLCRNSFGITHHPAVQQFNSIHYRPLLIPNQTSRIIFLNGTNDPFTLLSVADFRGNHTNPAIEAVMIQGGAHCSDLATPNKDDSTAVEGARLRTLQLLRGWVQPH